MQLRTLPQLATILHIQDFEEEQLRKGMREPPGLYEWTTADRFGQARAPEIQQH